MRETAGRKNEQTLVHLFVHLCLTHSFLDGAEAGVCPSYNVIING